MVWADGAVMDLHPPIPMYPSKCVYELFILLFVDKVSKNPKLQCAISPDLGGVRPN